MRTITIVYFSWVRERIGRSEEALSYPDHISTVSDLLQHLVAKDNIYQSAFENTEKLRFALDQNFVSTDVVISEAAELAIFPPVTGG